MVARYFRAFCKLPIGCLLLCLPLSLLADIGSQNHATPTQSTPKLAVFSLGALDNLLALGVPVHGAPKLRFLPRLNALNAVDIGTVHTANMEALYRLQPDLIIIDQRMAAQKPQLARIAKVLDVSQNPQGGAYIFANGIAQLRQFGAMFARQQAAADLIQQLQQKRQQTQKAAAHLGRGMVLMVIGKQVSLMDENSASGWLITELKLKTTAPGKIAPQRKITTLKPVSFEFIRAQNPDWMIVLDRNRAILQNHLQSAPSLFDNALVHRSKAYQNGRIFYLNSSEVLVAIASVPALLASLDDLKNQIQQSVAP